MDFGFKTLLVGIEGAHVTCTINREEALNALNEEVLNELSELCDQLRDQKELRSLVLRGAGDKAFVAGADIASMQNMSAGQALAFSRLGQSVTLKLEDLHLITIAAVHGYALGGGCELAMACDLIIATKSSQFGQPEVNLGLIAGFGGTQRLVRRVGLPVAMDMLVCGRGRSLSGDEAMQFGLISRVVHEDELDQTLATIRRSLDKVGPQAAKETKKLVRAALHSGNLRVGLEHEAKSFAHCFSGPEAEEGTSAFLAKRPPNFQG